MKKNITNRNTYKTIKIRNRIICRICKIPITIKKCNKMNLLFSKNLNKKLYDLGNKFELLRAQIKANNK